ncbi:MAG: hypothetical protein HZB66_03115, partial [Candidatus Aenigmarchaeota archaeon]|nr:hypothetical protein [Candidatus Aenigmarchaeota archaeon]
GKQIGHVHLSDSTASTHHLFFRDKKKIKNIFDAFESINYNGTLTLEMFYKNSEKEQLPVVKRRKLLLDQMKMIEILEKT